MRFRRWLDRGFVVYRWPAPLVVLFGALAITNPLPYLVTEGQGQIQRGLYAFAGVVALLATVWPRHILIRDALAFGASAACGWRAVTLIFNPGQYNTAEVAAYATVWLVIGSLVIQMLVLTWPTVMLDKRGKVLKREPARR